MTMKEIVQREIDNAIKSVWLNEICAEYGNGLFILERSLQCSLYHHLRNKLDALLAENSLYIYPELFFPDLGFYADIAICEMDMTLYDLRLRERVTDIAAIIELKYGGSSDYIKTDIPKVRTYIQSLPYDCQYYFGAIEECAECSRLYWLDKRSTNHWADGRFTELNAGRLDGTMYFEVNSYNHMGISHKRTPCHFTW